MDVNRKKWIKQSEKRERITAATAMAASVFTQEKKSVKDIKRARARERGRERECARKRAAALS